MIFCLHLIHCYADCNIKSDIVFLIDASNSVSENDLAPAKDMMYNFTQNLNISRGYEKIGIILIRTVASVYHRLDEHLNKSALLQKIKEIPYTPYHFTNVADGLCKLSQQAWRDDPSVLHVAVAILDGPSNHISSDCNGHTEHVASLIRTEYPHILVVAVGIGYNSYDELSLIASENRLIIQLQQYKQANGVSASLHYQICYTRT